MKLLVTERFKKFSNENFRIVNAKVIKVLEGTYTKSYITLNGNFPPLTKGEVLVVSGEVECHQKYGEYLKVTTYERPIPQTKEQIIAFLSSSLFKGIGKKIAETIYNELGKRTIEKIGKEGIYALENVKISDEKKQLIVSSVQENFLLGDIISHYAKYGITSDKVIRLYQLEKTTNIIENPYLFVKYNLLDFTICDQIAFEEGLMPFNNERLERAFEILLKEFTRNGHCYIEEIPFINRCMSYLNNGRTEKNQVSETTLINALLTSNVCMAEHGLIYPRALYFAEKNLAKNITRMTNIKTKPYNYLKVQMALDSLNTNATDEQTEAVHGFLKHNVFILTGDAGTGKTFTIDLMLRTALTLNPDLKIALTAPTGRAAKRIMESLNVEGYATTTHRLLGYGRNGNSNVPYYNENNKLEHDLVIADEFSMCDLVLGNNLVSALKDGATLCICGDKDQLESVGAGAVLKDLLETNVPHVHLSKIFRQSSHSKIHINGKRIKNGEMIDLENHPSQYFIETPTPYITSYVVASIRKLLKQGIDINDIMVLSAMKAGQCGVNALNEAIREIVNPYQKHKRELSLGNIVFREGDKIMCLVNRAEDDIYNGDIGYVHRVNVIDHEIIVNFDKNLVTFKRKDFTDLTLAFCSTIHKAQGNESKYVILVVSDEQQATLRRNLLYTGLTRASQTNIIIGQAASIQYAIKTVIKYQRNTNLARLINKGINQQKLIAI